MTDLAAVPQMGDPLARPTNQEDAVAGQVHAPYFCPTSGQAECCPECSGWDVCCNRPDLHRPEGRS